MHCIQCTAFTLTNRKSRYWSISPNNRPSNWQVCSSRFMIWCSVDLCVRNQYRNDWSWPDIESSHWWLSNSDTWPVYLPASIKWCVLRCVPIKGTIVTGDQRNLQKGRGYESRQNPNCFQVAFSKTPSPTCFSLDDGYPRMDPQS
jgi:hypothetical protein